MREIKFRAWDGDKFGYFGFQPKWFYFPDESYMEHSEISGSRIEFPAVGNTWQQYTGLNDKYGKEIYEGDIVTSDGVKWIIYWNVNGHWGYKRIRDGSCFTVDYWECQVIGNIYENPELLEPPHTESEE